VLNAEQNSGGLGNRLSRLSEKLKVESTALYGNIKNSLRGKVDGYLEQIENQAQPRIAGINIPSNRKEGVKNALLSFKGRLGEEEEFKIWLENLDERLEKDKCIVCLLPWGNDPKNIVLCKYCESGGHKEHIENWLKKKSICPLCRQALIIRDLLQIEI